MTPATPDTSEHHKIALTNVRVFDGQRLGDPSTVVIDGALIGSDADGARTVDGRGGVLLPGLIDAHVHLHGQQTFRQLAGHGVTTALDMATWPPSLVDSLRGADGRTDIRSAGTPAVAPGSRHSHIPGFPDDGLVDGPDAAERFVADRVAEGSDYIKIIVERDGEDALGLETLRALIAAAHRHDRRTIAHASSHDAVAKAHRAGVDIITHVPLDRAADQDLAERLAADGRVAVPTLSMMEGIVEQSAPPGADYAQARNSVTALHRAGVPILGGTDANASPGVPAAIPHGSSLHHELELLVDAGLSPLDALRAATSLPARHFGLADRGAIAPGLRSDLLLIDGDPLHDIRATRQIQHIWCAGIEHPVA